MVTTFIYGHLNTTQSLTSQNRDINRNFQEIEKRQGKIKVHINLEIMLSNKEGI